VGLIDADREELYGRLAEHAARDHIALPELERRVALIAEAETRAQAAEAFAGLPQITTATDPEPPQAPWFGSHADADGPGPGWKPTGERFRDPRTHRVMRVWEDLSGQRHYVPDE
jgi:Domain of unknown function (DUF1707)